MVKQFVNSFAAPSSLSKTQEAALAWVGQWPLVWVALRPVC